MSSSNDHLFGTLSTESLFAALECIHTIGFSDLLVLQPEQSVLLTEADRTAIEVMTILKAYESSSVLDKLELGLLPTTWDYVEIGEGKHRRVALVDPLLELLLITVTFQIAPTIERARVPISEHCVFSYRWIGADGGFDPDIGWGAFEREELASLRSSQNIAEIDISLFYESISEQLIETSLLKLGVEGESVSCLMKLLSHLRISEFGLPIGGHFSRILAEACLCMSDWSLIESGVRFIRFVDDYRIFADDRISLRRDMLIVTKTLGELGLSINKSKLKISKSKDLLETRLLTTDIRIEGKNRSKMMLVKDHFDPYSQLVGHRVEELKSISNSESLSEVLAHELDKIEPNYRSLKFIFSAMTFSNPVEQLDCLKLIYQNLKRRILNRLSLSIFNLTSRLIDSIDDEHRTELADILWDHLRVEFNQCAAGTLCHWVRTLSSLGSDSTIQREWRLHIISSLDTPILLRREVLQWELSLHGHFDRLSSLLSLLRDSLPTIEWEWLSSLLTAMDSNVETLPRDDDTTVAFNLLERLR